MKTFHINMQQFNTRFKVFQDNLVIFETIKENNGVFSCFKGNVQKYVEWLNEFNIFYTIR